MTNPNLSRRLLALLAASIVATFALFAIGCSDASQGASNPTSDRSSEEDQGFIAANGIDLAGIDLSNRYQTTDIQRSSSAMQPLEFFYPSNWETFDQTVSFANESVELECTDNPNYSIFFYDGPKDWESIAMGVGASAVEVESIEKVCDCDMEGAVVAELALFIESPATTISDLEAGEPSSEAYDNSQDVPDPMESQISSMSMRIIAVVNEEALEYPQSLRFSQFAPIIELADDVSFYCAVPAFDDDSQALSEAVAILASLNKTASRATTPEPSSD